MERRRILLVDEDPHALESLSGWFERAGIKASAVTNGKDAVALYEREGFDLVLSELELSNMNGLEVLATLRQRDPSAAVIIMSANGESQNREAALRLGAKEFLKKPLDEASVMDAVERNLERGSGAIVRGDLRAMSLPSIIQANCSERNRARLLLRRGDEEGSMFFAGGDVVHAYLGALVGEEAVFELLHWDSGDFELEMGASAPERSIALGGSALLLEGLRRLDEGTTGLDPERERTEAVERKNNADPNTRIAKALRGIVGAQGVIICSREGGVLAQDVDGDPSEDAALAAFLGHRAEVLSRHLRGGPLQRVVLSGDARLTTIVPHEQNHIVLIAEPRASAESLADEIQTVLRRYRGDGG